MYLRDPTEVLWEQIFVFDEVEDFLFRPVANPIREYGITFQYLTMRAAHLHNFYKFVHQALFSCKDEKLFRNNFNPSFPGQFVGYLQLFSEKTATAISSLVAYPIHVVLLNTCPVRREYLINNCYIIIGFLPVSTSDFNIDQEDSFGYMLMLIVKRFLWIMTFYWHPQVKKGTEHDGSSQRPGTVSSGFGRCFRHCFSCTISSFRCL